jgi:ribonuclease VapC
MIFVDASAMTAALKNEPAADRIFDCLEGNGPFFTTPIAVYETVLAVARISKSTVPDATADVIEFLSGSLIEVRPIVAEQGVAALSAFARFGKGRHPAKLNMGDCFAYAAARAHNAKILFVGDDFTHTDLESAVPAR